MQKALYRSLVSCKLMQLGILEIKITLPHRAFHMRDRVAHHAAQPSLRFWAMHDLFDRRIHQSAVKHSRIMTTAAPLRRARADGVLHVLNALAIPLVVKRGELVLRAEPLVVNVLMAALA